MDLNGFHRGAHRDLRCIEFCHAGGQIIILPLVLEPSRFDHQVPRGLNLGRHVGQFEGDGLVFGNLLAEGFPLLGVGQRQFVST